MTSFRAKKDAGDIATKGIFKVKPAGLIVEPGFNWRRETPAYFESIERLAQYIAKGGQIPPLECLARENGMLVVDGHRRRLAILRAIELGATIEFVDIIPFEGGDDPKARRMRIPSSNANEKLEPLELAMGFKISRDVDGMSPQEIADEAGFTIQRVNQLLTLADAPDALHQAVEGNTISAAEATKLALHHGDKVTEVLAGEMAKAQAAGKGKITAGTMKAKALPPQVIQNTIAAVESFAKLLPKATHEILAAVKAGTAPADSTVTITAADLAELLAARDDVVDARNEQKRKAKAKAEKAKQAALKAEAAA